MLCVCLVNWIVLVVSKQVWIERGVMGMSTGLSQIDCMCVGVAV